MSRESPPVIRFPIRLVLVVLLAAAGSAGALYGYFLWRRAHPAPSWADEKVPEARPEQVRAFCGACHAYPPPDTFPRHAWRHEVLQGFRFSAETGGFRDLPDPRAFQAYYQNRAPESLLVSPEPSLAGPPPVYFERSGIRLPGDEQYPIITHMNLARLSDARHAELLVCDMRTNHVFALSPSQPSSTWRTLAEVPFPAHAEAADLDGDAIKDVLVACLGMFLPSNDKVGRVMWLRGKADGTFTPVTLLKDVGRVADVQVADFNGDGRLDLIVAVFGWRTTGEIMLLENQTTAWDQPKFVTHILDHRHGAIHVPVADLNGDGEPDFVALISQEHETIVAFLNDGKGRFEKRIIYTAPHPSYGSSGIQLVDISGDGRLDVLYTNGDVLDPPYLLKPYHSVQWLENPGDGAFPWKHHHLAIMPGVMRALAADLDGDSDTDIVAVAYLPADRFPERERRQLDAVILLEQIPRVGFVRHSLETATCDHLALAIGDWEGNGRTGLVIGNGCFLNKTRPMDALTLWRAPKRTSPK